MRKVPSTCPLNVIVGAKIYVNQCSGFTNKQHTAVHATGNLEWIYQECQNRSSRPDDEEEYESSAESPNIHVDLKKRLGVYKKKWKKQLKKKREMYLNLSCITQIRWINSSKPKTHYVITEEKTRNS